MLRTAPSVAGFAQYAAPPLRAARGGAWSIVSLLRLLLPPLMVATTSIVTTNSLERRALESLDAHALKHGVPLSFVDTASAGTGGRLQHMLRTSSSLVAQTGQAAARAASRRGEPSPPHSPAAKVAAAPAAAASPAAALPSITGPRAPKPKMLDLSSAARVASEALMGELHIGGGAPPEGVAWPSPALPDSCWGNLGFNKTKDAECYWTMESLLQRERSVHTDYSFCWGRGAGADGVASLLVHTLLLTSLPLHTMRLFYTAFLATQCCDTVLWVWHAPEIAGNVTAHLASLALPPAALARIHLRPWDASAAWRELTEGSPPLLDVSSEPGLAVAAGEMGSRPEHTKRAQWCLLLILAKWGGTYVEPDMIMLRDWRPLLRLPVPWGYRDAFNIFAAGGALKLDKLPTNADRKVGGECGSPRGSLASVVTRAAPLLCPPTLPPCMCHMRTMHLFSPPHVSQVRTEDILMKVLRFKNPASSYVSYDAVTPRYLGEREHFGLLSIVMFDITMLRCVRGGTRVAMGQASLVAARLLTTLRNTALRSC